MRALLPTRGTSLSIDGPGDSARIRWIDRAPIFGISASVSTSTPMPPTQWVKLRQNSSPFGSASTSVRIVEPVVVKPEVASKKQSTSEGMLPWKKNGSPPKNDTRIHPSATIAKPSRARRLSLRGRSSDKSPPTAIVIAMEIRIAGASPPPISSETTSGTAISAASTISTLPISLNVNRLFMAGSPESRRRPPS